MPLSIETVVVETVVVFCWLKDKMLAMRGVQKCVEKKGAF